MRELFHTKSLLMAYAPFIGNTIGDTDVYVEITKKRNQGKKVPVIWINKKDIVLNRCKTYQQYVRYVRERDNTLTYREAITVASKEWSIIKLKTRELIQIKDQQYVRYVRVAPRLVVL
jgi:predicted GTPase